jgi:cystathionine gamma-lyase
MGTITVNSKELHDKIYFTAKSFGGCPSAFDFYMALRGLKTLKLRMVP